MTTNEYTTQFTTRSSFALTEWTWVVGTGTWVHYACFLATDKWGDYNMLELYYSWFRSGSAWYFCGVRNVSSGSWTNGESLTIHGWTYDGSNTNRGVGASNIYSSSSTYAVAHHTYKLILNRTTWDYEMRDNTTKYKTWTLSSSLLSTVNTNLATNVYFYIASQNAVTIETAWIKMYN